MCLPCVPIRASKRGQRKIARFLLFFKTAPLITLISFFSGSGSHYPGGWEGHFFFFLRSSPTQFTDSCAGTVSVDYHHHSEAQGGSLVAL